MTKFLDKRLGEIFKTRKPKSKNTFVDPFKDCKLLNDKEVTGVWEGKEQELQLQFLSNLEI